MLREWRRVPVGIFCSHILRLLELVPPSSMPGLHCILRARLAARSGIGDRFIILMVFVPTIDPTQFANNHSVNRSRV